MEKIKHNKDCDSNSEDSPRNHKGERCITDLYPVTPMINNPTNTIQTTTSNSDINDLHVQQTKVTVFNLVSEYNIDLPTTSNDRQKITIEAEFLLPDNIFEGLKYSDNNKHHCYGTVAFKCRKFSNDDIDQSTCCICKNDWNGIRKGTYTYKHSIDWRYGEEMGKLMIQKSKSPVFYFRHMLRHDVHSAHYQKVVCPGCKDDVSFLSIPDDHSCETTTEYDRESNYLSYLPHAFYVNKHVILTFSRSSAQSICSSIKLIDEHNKKCNHCVDHIPRLYSNTCVEDIVYGQRYHKSGQCRTTIINSTRAQTGFRSFNHIAYDINVTFSEATAIYLMMRVTSDMCSSPFYIRQFLATITYPLSRIFIVFIKL
jgi:hypothetical protein